jgi:hypothetical protein
VGKPIMSFLDNYEDAATKIRLVHEAAPTHRVENVILDFDAEKGFILVETRIYRNYEDEKFSFNNFAFGRVESYQPSMKRWFVEDTTTSAIARAASLFLGSRTIPSKENMQQVENMPVSFVNKVEEDPWSKPIWEEGFTTAKTAVQEIQATLGGVQVAAAPICPHGHMIWRAGEKGGKAWGGYMCVEKSKPKQCPPRWYVLASDGQWKPQV